MRLVNALLLLFVALAPLSCGYNFASHDATALPENTRTLFIESVENPTTETWLGPLVRSMFRDELTRRGWTNWDSRGNADGLVQITIDKFSRTSTVTDENADTLKFVSSISLSAQITDRDSGEVLWNSGSVSWGGTYYGTNSSPETTADTFATDHAIRRLADLLSQGY